MKKELLEGIQEVAPTVGAVVAMVLVASEITLIMFSINSSIIISKHSGSYTAVVISHSNVDAEVLIWPINSLIIKP